MAVIKKQRGAAPPAATPHPNHERTIVIRKEAPECRRTPSQVPCVLIAGIWLAVTPVPAAAGAGPGPHFLSPVDHTVILPLESTLAKGTADIGVAWAELKNVTEAAKHAPPDRQAMLVAVAAARFRKVGFKVAADLRKMSAAAGLAAEREASSLGPQTRSHCPEIVSAVQKQGPAGTGLSTKVKFIAGHGG